MTIDDESEVVLTAFIIGPIGDRDGEHGSSSRLVYEDGVQTLENIIFPACESLGVRAFRADHISQPGEIPEQVFRLLRDSEIVIADLTDANPNVMYELGLRHSIGKLTIQIGERGRLPFDISAIRTILFKRTESGLIDARRALVKALSIGLEVGGDAVTATRVWHERSVVMASPVSVENAEMEDGGGEEEAGFLEHLSDMEDSIQLIGQNLDMASSVMDSMTAIFNDGAERVNSIDGSGGYSSRRLAIANDIATKLELPATQLNAISLEFARNVKRAEPGLHYLMNSLIEDPEQLRDAADFPEAVRALATGAASSIVHAAAFDQSVVEIGRATRSMKRVTKTISSGVKKIIDTSRTIAGWERHLDRLP